MGSVEHYPQAPVLMSFKVRFARSELDANFCLDNQFFLISELRIILD